MVDNFILAPVDMPAPLGFENWLTFWLILVIAVVNGVIMLFMGYKFLQIMQLSGYKLNGFFVWLKSTKYGYIGRLLILSFLSSAALLITNVLLSDFFYYKIMTYSGLLFYLLFSIVFILNVYNAPQKTPLKYTKRVNRLCAVLFIVVFAFTFLIMSASSLYIPYFDYGAVGLTPLFLPILFLIAYFITWPIEYLISLAYIKKSKKVLSTKKNLKVIGITGSYGKTSVKNILYTLLSVKYKVCATPYSYNTPLGLSKTILNNLNNNDEIFIAEMGAKYVGDIAFLSKMVKPDIAVITGIGNQHLATFGSEENLINTKFEIVKNLNVGGEAYFNFDSTKAKLLYEKANCKKYFSGIDELDSSCKVSNIQLSKEGSTFELSIADKSIIVKTVLLGKHNISNILLCSFIAYNLGLSMEEIQMGISKLTPSAHRLAIVPSANALTVIDDAYNGSVEGSKAALDVLKEFDGQKIVVTPGIVELGQEEFNANFEFGKNMASVCDYVIINGVVNYDAIYNGLLFGNFEDSKILRAGSLNQAVEIMSKITRPGDVVLFENDLPDNYT